MSTVSRRNSAIRAAVIALASASHVENNRNKLHLEPQTGIGVKEVLLTPRQLSGITGSCRSWKALIWARQAGESAFVGQNLMMLGCERDGRSMLQCWPTAKEPDVILWHVLYVLLRLQYSTVSVERLPPSTALLKLTDITSDQNYHAQPFVIPSIRNNVAALRCTMPKCTGSTEICGYAPS